MIEVTEKVYKDIEEKVGKKKMREVISGTLTNAKPNTKPKKDKKFTMPNQLENNTTNIIQLHNSILTKLEESLADAITIGGLLFEQKKLVKHGQFTKWVKENLPFKIRTAQRYMKLAAYQEALEEKGVTSITDAYYHVFSEPISDEIMEADDGLATSIVTTTQSVDLDKIKLPKKTPKGLVSKIGLDKDTVNDVVNGTGLGWENCKGTYSKIIVEIRGNSKERMKHKEQMGEFIIAVGDYLRKGGKLIFVKK